MVIGYWVIGYWVNGYCLQSASGYWLLVIYPKPPSANGYWLLG